MPLTGPVLTTVAVRVTEALGLAVGLALLVVTTVVVVSTTHDPATPYQAGVDLARELGAPLITYEGTQHTVVFNGDQCVDGAVDSYLIDGFAPENLRCWAR